MVNRNTLHNGGTVIFGRKVLPGRESVSDSSVLADKLSAVRDTRKHATARFRARVSVSGYRPSL
ncbi:hypothetical protein J6590_039508 [Homalodisca vitripennis]|nr:hypothetical protein J6590_039508 [Homalodisca vitripennis]